jgi:hypothetical protein
LSSISIPHRQGELPFGFGVKSSFIGIDSEGSTEEGLCPKLERLGVYDALRRLGTGGVGLPENVECRRCLAGTPELSEGLELTSLRIVDRGPRGERSGLFRDNIGPPYGIRIVEENLERRGIIRIVHHQLLNLPLGRLIEEVPDPPGFIEVSSIYRCVELFLRRTRLAGRFHDAPFGF